MYFHGKFNAMNGRAKIIASIGPASSEKEILKEMVQAGMNVVRLNFSHGTHEQHAKNIQYVREIQSELKINISILGDLSGPKLRLGKIENEPIFIEKDQIVRFTTNQNDKSENISFHVEYCDFAKDVKQGNRILIDDGKIKLESISGNGKDVVEAKVVFGGPIFSRKGINLPDSHLSVGTLSEKDKKDILFAIEQEIDWLALSFVRQPQDIEAVKDYVAQYHGNQSIIAKIEKPEAVKNIDQIISIADGIMVARGDLGVEMDYNKVPVIQKNIVSKCVNQSKPVIIATQMLESMIQNFRPTRAEANDVANAVMDLADAVMLSGETAVGNFPVESIHSMQEIILHTEEYGVRFNRNHPPHDLHDHFIPDSVCYNAFKMAQQTGAKVIIPFTYSGYTAFRISSHRPKAEIHAFTFNKALIRKLPLVWGVNAHYFPVFNDTDQAIEYTINILKDEGILQTGDIAIHVGSTPLTAKSDTNMIKLSII
jgi:pyruvate kinase